MPLAVIISMIGSIDGAVGDPLRGRGAAANAVGTPTAESTSWRRGWHATQRPRA